VTRALGSRSAGAPPVESSYTEFLVNRLTGAEIGRTAADWLAGVVFAAIAVATVVVWLREWLRRRQRGTAANG